MSVSESGFRDRVIMGRATAMDPGTAIRPDLATTTTMTARPADIPRMAARSGSMAPGTTARIIIAIGAVSPGSGRAADGTAIAAVGAAGIPAAPAGMAVAAGTAAATGTI